jgi:anti-sigma-K factor RskA
MVQTAVGRIPPSQLDRCSIRARGRGGLVAAWVAVPALAFLVAAAIKRDPPDFSALPVIAVVPDATGRPLWAIRLARAAHEIAVDVLGAKPPAPGHAYQLWFNAPEGGHSLGLLPVAGRRVIPEIPGLAARLAGAGELIVTLEPARGATTAHPRNPVVFRAAFAPASSAASGAPEDAHPVARP